MTIDELLGRLTGVKRSGSSWAAKCPAHEDRAPSLSISLGENDRVLVYCHAGCSVAAICGALGIGLNELFPDHAPEPPEGCTLPMLANRVRIPAAKLSSWGLADDEHTINGQRIPAVLVPYRDAAGQSLRDKYRIRLFGGDKYRWGAGTGGAHLYGLWRLSEFRTRGALIITEGESDTWALWAEGVPAIAVPGATQAALLQADHLAGFSKVWVTQDNDEAGEAFVKAVGERLEALGAVRPRRIAAAAPHKDIADWRAAAGEAFLDEFKRACQVAPDFGQRKIPLLLGSSLRQRPLDFVVEPYFPRGYLVLIGGKPGMGKTMICCKAAAAVTTGTPMCGSPTAGPARAIMYSAEDDPHQVLRPRLLRSGARMDRVLLRDFDSEDFALDRDGLGELEEVIREFNPLIVFLDPIVAFLGDKTDMNKANEVRSRLRPLAQLAQRTNVCIVVVAHVKKGAVTSAIDSIVGSMDFMAAVRSALVTFRDPEARPDKEQGMGYVLAHAKHNLTAPGKPLRYLIRSAEDNQREPELIWRGSSSFNIEELQDLEGKNLGQLREAVDVLRPELENGPKTFKQMKAILSTAGVSREVLESAMTMLRTKRNQDGTHSLQGDPVPVQEVIGYTPSHQDDEAAPV